MYTLKTLMEVNNHSYIDILKIDVEGSEYETLTRFMNDFEGQELPIGQVMIELHLVDDQHVNFKVFMDWWERLEAFGMRPVWEETNLLAVTLSIGDADPRCTEYVWINANDHRSLLRAE
jgi:Methyltransferase FkbM domain